MEAPALVSDGLGSVRQVVTSAGASTATFEPDAFGVPLSSSGSADLLAQTYVGALGQRNEGGGIYYARQRWYDSSLGRWLSQDPIGFDGGLNLFGYVGQNPMNGVDPSGLIKINADFTAALMDYLAGQHRAGNLRQYRHPNDLVQAAVREADRILDQAIADTLRGPASKHKATVRDLAQKLKAKINCNEYVWGYDPDKKGEYAGTPLSPTTNPRTKATPLLIKDITPGSRRFPGVSIEENLAAHIIHEAFHAMRSDIYGECRTSDHDDISGDERGPLYWFTRGVLKPYWSPAWGPSQW